MHEFGSFEKIIKGTRSGRRTNYTERQMFRLNLTPAPRKFYDSLNYTVCLVNVSDKLADHSLVYDERHQPGMPKKPQRQ